MCFNLAMQPDVAPSRIHGERAAARAPSRGVVIAHVQDSCRHLKMKLSFVTPREELRQFVESFWVFESATGIPLDEQNLAVPNGCAKLIIPYENSLFGTSDGRAGVSHEHGFYFVGNRVKATLIHSSARRTGFIGIELFPNGAFPLFGIPMHETVEEKIFDSDVLFGQWVGRRGKSFVT